jgi:hypothetical protein
VSGVEEVGAALAAIGVAQTAVSQTEGALEWTSDQVTYPKDTAMAEGTMHHETPAAHFFCPSYAGEDNNDTVFVLRGDFSENPPRMLNVAFDQGQSTTYSHSSLSFHARADDTAHGTGAAPELHFHCAGRFNPAGPGDADYRVTLAVNTRGEVHVLAHDVRAGEPGPEVTDHGAEIAGWGTPTLTDMSPNGFRLDIA